MAEIHMTGFRRIADILRDAVISAQAAPVAGCRDSLYLIVEAEALRAGIATADMLGTGTDAAVSAARQQAFRRAGEAGFTAEEIGRVLGWPT